MIKTISIIFTFSIIHFFSSLYCTNRIKKQDVYYIEFVYKHDTNFVSGRIILCPKHKTDFEILNFYNNTVSKASTIALNKDSFVNLLQRSTVYVPLINAERLKLLFHDTSNYKKYFDNRLRSKKGSNLFYSKICRSNIIFLDVLSTNLKKENMYFRIYKMNIKGLGYSIDSSVLANSKNDTINLFPTFEFQYNNTNLILKKDILNKGISNDLFHTHINNYCNPPQK